jgi:subtilase family serine protease
VSAYLSGAGLKVTGVEAHRRYVEASGSASQLNSAFGVQLGTFSHDGQTVTAPSTAASVPTSVAGSVLTVTGLDTTAYTKSANHIGPDKQTKGSTSPNVKPPDGFANARPCSIFYGQIQANVQADFTTPLPPLQGQTLSYAPCGYTGPQFRSAYENNTTLDGSGVTVAITDAYAWQKIAQDANRYATEHGDGAYAPGQLTQVLPASFNRGGQCGPSGWSGEETLDVEAVHAMAPGAKIRYYASASCFDDDFLVTLQKVVDENIASLVTNSWSDLEENESAANVAAYEQVFLQGAAQGQTFLFSSGDNGDEVANSGLKQVDYPASDPYVTAAAGTSTGINRNGKISMQTGWGTEKHTVSTDGKSWEPQGFLYGAGGGFSSLFNRPAYQNGAVSSPYRGVPDVSMDGDPSTGMLIGQTQTFPDGVHYGEYRIGGTSLSSPLLAWLRCARRAEDPAPRLGQPRAIRERGLDHRRPPGQGPRRRARRLRERDGWQGWAGLLGSYLQPGLQPQDHARVGPVTGLGVPSPTLVAAPTAP